MSNSAELSSVATAVQELAQRVTAMADAALNAKDEATATDLYEAERALRTATKRLTRLANE
jgi:hypothetical protein